MNSDNWLFAPIGSHELVIHCLYIFIAASLVNWLQHKICKRAHAYLLKTINIWDDTFIQALSLPLSLIIWIYAITLSGEYLVVSLHHLDWIDEVQRFRLSSFIMLLVWFFWRFTNLVEHRLVHLTHQTKRKMDTNTIATIGRFVRIGLGVIVLLIILESVGLPLNGLVAFGGGGALAMGIAAQHILANWFGGLMIFLDRPFKPNEWISSPDRHIEGKVVEIGWRTTKIIGVDNYPLYIPNSIFSQVIISNMQRVTHRKIEATIGLRYEDAHAISDIVKSIDMLLRTYPSVDLDERYMVHFIGFDNSALNIHFLCSVRELDITVWRNMQQDIFLKVLDIITRHKARLAYPTLVTWLPEDYSIKNKSS